VTSEDLRSRLADDGAEPLVSTPGEYAADIDRRRPSGRRSSRPRARR
jgi:hypothetical protein